MKDAAAKEIQGLSPTAIRERLGEPSKGYSDTDSWWYYLGPEPGAFSVDSLWLVVEISGDDVVSISEQTD